MGRKPRQSVGCIGRRLVALMFVMVTLGCSERSTESAHARQEEPAATASPDPTPKTKLRFHAPPVPPAAGAVGGDWPSFLGPDRTGAVHETKLLKKFPPGGPPLVWEFAKGEGYAAPVIVAKRLVLFHRVGEFEVVECMRAETGKPLWSFRYPTTYVDRYSFGNGPRSSPTIDGDKVYTIGVEAKLHCLNMQSGELVWKRDLKAEFNMPHNYFGTGSTPLIEGDLLIVNVGSPGGPSVVALNKSTGVTVWQAMSEWGESYASPIAATILGKRRVLVFAGGDIDPPTGGMLSLDPTTGAVDARYPFRGKSYTSVNASTPVMIGDDVFISSGYKTGGVLLSVSDKKGFEPVWKSSALGAHFATPIHRDGFLYGVDGSGQSSAAVVCVDCKTGERRWRHVPDWVETVDNNGTAREVHFSVFSGAMILADSHFLILGENGHLAWADLTPNGYEELSRTWLFFANECWTAPVLSQGLLYVMRNKPDKRTGHPAALLCYDLRENE